ncbi:hypothetical protein AB0E69_33260 [Kribbella sp. NPDC026611]|uniref:hypothetical protein n=1 Tax=Kribbella sp. NPDC026611 TaxID=3154911 RepID=UPI0033DD55AF
MRISAIRREHPPAWIVLVPTVLLFWVSFLMPTKCDYMTERRKPCDRGVRGKLRGCHDHARWKRDAMFASLGTSNPGRRFRVMWAAPDSSTRPQAVRSHPAPASESNARRGMYDLVMLVATVGGTVVGVVTLLLS